MSDRVQRAREEIGRRRALAQAATPGPWECDARHHMGHILAGTGRPGERYGIARAYDDPGMNNANADHIAANDPARVLAVLDGHESVLDRHAPLPRGAEGFCSRCLELDDLSRFVAVPWPCPDALAVLDLYAPEATP